jgi:parallel beta-helix repeat protein
MIFGLITIVDVTLDYTLNAQGTTFYVNETGSGGAYTSIMDAILASNHGDTVFVYNGSYYENVAINKRINLIGEDMNGTLIDRMGNGADVYIFSDWVNITGFTISNSGASGNDAGIDISDSNNISISYNNISSNDVGIYITPSSSYINIIGNIISSNSEDGIHMYTGDNNIIGNKIISNVRIGLNIDSNGPFSERNNVINNNISLNSYGMGCKNSNWSEINNNTIVSNTNYGLVLLSASNNTIMNNNVSNNEYGIYLKDSNENTIKYNTASNIYDGIQINTSLNNNVIDNRLHDNFNGINLWLSSNNKISKNNISSSRGNGIHLNNSNDNSIIENNISSGGNWGIWLISSSSNRIFRNEIYWNQWTGIELRPLSDGNYIIDNNIHSNNVFGLTLWHASNNTIIGNKLTQNNNYNIGLYISSNNLILYNDISFCNSGIDLASSNNTITMNKIYSNFWAGIFAGDASDNYITKNDISNNDYGVYITTNSHNNRIYHNNLINNNNQAIDEQDDNFWNDSYPSGGNYWSDYGGIDLNSTPSQDVPPPDGIGDTPYVIDLDSQDNYPLIDPYTNSSFLHEGWNLISIPLIQSDTNINSVLLPLIGSYDAVQYFDTTDSNDPWKHNHTLKPEYLNDFKNIDHIIGFWIHIIEPGGVPFDYSGTQPTSNQTVQLHPGWNMVGYPSLSSHNRAVGLNNLTFDTHVDAIQWYDAGAKSWHFMGPSDNFIPGRGYWVHSKVEAEWEVPI